MLREIRIRYLDVDGTFTRPILTAEDVAEYAYQAMALHEGTPDRETAIIVPLDARRMPLGHLRVDGLAGCVAVDVQTTIGTVLRLGADEWVLSHVHPSGDPTPSAADVEQTDRLAAISELCNIKLVGHVVVTSSGKWRSVSNPRSYGTLDRVQKGGPTTDAPRAHDAPERTRLELD